MNTVSHVLNHAVSCYPNLVALVEGDRRVTYRELGENVARTIAVLRELSVGKGDRVAVLAQNSVQFVELWLAVPMIGAALAPLNTRLTMHELRPIIEEYDPHLFFADGDIAAARSLVLRDTDASRLIDRMMRLEENLPDPLEMLPMHGDRERSG